MICNVAAEREEQPFSPAHLHTALFNPQHPTNFELPITPNADPRYALTKTTNELNTVSKIYGASPMDKFGDYTIPPIHSHHFHLYTHMYEK